MRRLLAWMMLAAGIAAAPATPEAQGPQTPPAERPRPEGTTGSRVDGSVNMVLSEPSFFYGNQVTFEQPVVAGFLTPYLFKIRDGDGPKDNTLLVLAPAPTRVPPAGTIVVVEGEIRQFLPAQFVTEFPWFERAIQGVDLDDYQGGPVVVARRVELPAGKSLIMK